MERTLKQRVVNAAFWLGATRAFGQAISWAITVYVARLLSPADYGLMGMAIIFTGFIVLFNEIGLGTAIIQKQDLDERDLSSIYWIILPLNVLLYILSYTTAPYIAVFFNEPRLVSLIRLLSFTFIINGIGSVSYYMLTKKILFNRRSQAEFSGNIVGGFSTLILAADGYGVWSLVYGSLLREGVRNALFIAFYPWRPTLFFSIQRIRGMLNFGAKVIGARFLWYGYANSDYIIGGKILGKTLLGFYFLAFQFATIPLDKLVSLVTDISLPMFSEIQHDRERLKRAFLQVIHTIAFVTFPIFIGMMLVADDAVYLLLTTKWAPVILPLKVLCVVSTMRALNSVNAPLVVALGSPGIAMISNLSLTLIMPVAFYIGSFYGLSGFSYAWVFAFPPIYICITFVATRKIGLGLSEYFAKIGYVITGTLLMALCVISLQTVMLSGHLRWVRLSASILTGGAVYLAFFMLVNRTVLSEAIAFLRPGRT